MANHQRILSRIDINSPLMDKVDALRPTDGGNDE